MHQPAGAAVQLTALVTLIAGIAVLAGTVASTEAQRLADSVILKVLGATRVSIAIAWLLEYALLACWPPRRQPSLAVLPAGP